MAPEKRGVTFAPGPFASPNDIARSARWHFLEALGRAAPDVLGTIADDDLLEHLFDAVNEGIYYAGSPRAYDYGVRSWRDLQNQRGARAELKALLEKWAAGYGLDKTWTWLLDTIISTLWHWREAQWRGRPPGKTVWLPHNHYHGIILDEYTSISFTYMLQGRGLHDLDKESLWKEFIEGARPAFETFYSALVADRLGGDAAEVRVLKQKGLAHFEWLALWQFEDYTIPMLVEHTGLCQTTIGKGLENACGHLGVNRRQNPGGRPTEN